MLSDFSEKLNTLRIVLGSQSPRRQSILKDNLGLDFSIIIPKFNEDIPKSSCSSPSDYVYKTCQAKAASIINELNASELPNVIITADTIVVLGDSILEKPNSFENAFTMLNSLSGTTHNVLTSVTIATLTDEGNENKNLIDKYKIETFVESTSVSFSSIPEKCIISYIETGEPFDKAGGYGIQGLASSFVSAIQGCYFNVMGFPVYKFSVYFRKYLDNRS